MTNKQEPHVGDKVSVVAWGGEQAEIVDETERLFALLTSTNIGIFQNVGFQIVWVPKDKLGEWYDSI